MFCCSRPVKEYMMFKRNIDMTPQMDDVSSILAVLAWPSQSSLMTCIGSPSVALLSFTCGDFIEENSSKKFSRDPLASCCFLRLGAIRFLLDRTALADSCVVSAKWTGLQLLVCVWCLLMDWTEINRDWNHLKELFLNRSTSLVS